MDPQVPGMNEQHERALSEGFRALAATTSQAGASLRVEAAVLARMRSAAGAGGTPRTLSAATRWFSLAAAAVLVAVSGAGVWLASRTSPAAPGRVVIEPMGFVEIPGASVLPPIESGSIIRVALPAGALPQYGLAVQGDAVGGLVKADLLVAQDGVPRAIRLVSETTRSSAP